MKRILIFGLLVICLVFSGVALAANKVVNDPLKAEIAKLVKDNNGDIDPAIIKMLEKGTDPRALVKACIEMGYEACKVTMVAINEKADRQMVIFGALDGGATNEQLALCEGLGYSYDPSGPTSDTLPPRGPVSNSVPK
jgi:hypothetical protein